MLFLPGSVRPRPLPPKLLPPKLLAEKFVALTPFHVEPLNRKRFEEQFHGADLGSMRAALLLRRRNDVTMYGKLHSEYAETTPDYIAMTWYSDASDAKDALSEFRVPNLAINLFFSLIY